MGIRPSPLRRLDKPEALLESLRLIRESARVTRSLTAYLDHADGETTWRPPRSERFAPQGTLEGRPFEAPADTVSRSLEHLRQHRRELPTQTFVFVLSDFLDELRPALLARLRGALWDVVPVVIQDPTWEQSFPSVAGVAVPYASPDDGSPALIRLSRTEVSSLRRQNEARLESLLRRFRSNGFDPLVLGTSAPAAVDTAFLRWARRRQLRGRRR